MALNKKISDLGAAGALTGTEIVPINQGGSPNPKVTTTQDIANLATGTGTVTHTAGALTSSAIVVGNGAADVKVLASLGTTTTVLHGNAAGLPTFGAVALAADVSGTLPVANGGTGITSFGTGVATFLGTPSSANLAAALTDETGSGAAVFASAPTLVNPVVGTQSANDNSTKAASTAYVDAAVAGAGGGTVTHTAGALTASALMVGNGSADSKVLASLGSTTTVLHGNAAGLPTFGAVSLTADVSGTLPVANGGTGITSFGTGVATFLGTPSSANLAAAVTDETGSGALVFATSPTLVTPALGTPASGNLSSCTADGTNAVGFRHIPQNSQSAAYTTVLGDAGKHILHPSADTTARTITIDSNANVAYPVGTAITFVNQASAGVMTIAITSDTMRLAGPGTTGSRTLAANGIATALKLTSTEWIISGTGLT